MNTWNASHFYFPSSFVSMCLYLYILCEASRNSIGNRKHNFCFCICFCLFFCFFLLFKYFFWIFGAFSLAEIQYKKSSVLLPTIVPQVLIFCFVFVFSLAVLNTCVYPSSHRRKIPSQVKKPAFVETTSAWLRKGLLYI